MNKAPFTLLALLLITGPAGAAKKDAPPPVTEPIKCYEAAWGSKQDPENNPGLGLNAGQAVTLCTGRLTQKRLFGVLQRLGRIPTTGV
jgi:hypothetical protein